MSSSFECDAPHGSLVAANAGQLVPEQLVGRKREPPGLQRLANADEC
jgi:hypothetical protein